MKPGDPGGNIDPMSSDLDWLDRALAKARQRNHAVDGPVPQAPPPAAPAPEPEPPLPRGPAIPAGPRGDAPPTGDLIRDALRRLHRH